MQVPVREENCEIPAIEIEAIAVVTLRTFALGKLDLLTVLPRETSI